MLIGINASSALKKNPTGVEEYTYQLIKHLAMIPESRAHRFVLYLNPRLKSSRLKDFEKLPENFQIKFLRFPIFWTQIGLAREMIFSKIDALFIPVHILPIIHPRKSIVALHGLEYEFFPKMYPLWHRLYLRWSTKYALNRAAKIIAVSENTKQDLVRLYGGNLDKISTIHHGATAQREARSKKQEVKDNNYILYIGRIELKKNIMGIVKAYNLLRIQNAELKTKLILAGGEGFGFRKIRDEIKKSPFFQNIIIKGYIAEKEKIDLLRNAEIFIYPSFYEGFGMPILEAQIAGAPVITSNISSMPEISGEGAIFVNPNKAEKIAEAAAKILNDKKMRQELIQKGFKNAERFSWEKCARETLAVFESL